jgi:hypothetical protein
MAQAAASNEHEWEDWYGGTCPCPSKNVQVQLRSDESREAAEKVSGARGAPAIDFSWVNTDSAGDIVAFRVVG